MDLHKVTEDTELTQRLIDMWEDEEENGATVDYMFSLGLRPPGYEEGREYTVSVVYLPGSTDPLLVWNTSDFGETGDVPEETEAEYRESLNTTGTESSN